MTNVLSAWGMLDLADDWNLGPNGPVEPTPMEIEAAEAEWNAPPPPSVTIRTARPPIPPMPPEHADFLGRIAVAVNEALIAEHSLERANPRLLWVAVVRKEGAPGLVRRVRQACDRLIAAGEVAADDWRIGVLRAIRAELTPGCWGQL